MKVRSSAQLHNSLPVPTYLCNATILEPKQALHLTLSEDVHLKDYHLFPNRLFPALEAFDTFLLFLSKTFRNDLFLLIKPNKRITRH